MADTPQPALRLQAPQRDAQPISGLPFGEQLRKRRELYGFHGMRPSGYRSIEVVLWKKMAG
jgi:hypothetical protein